jgi:hypothetical protein
MVVKVEVDQSVDLHFGSVTPIDYQRLAEILIEAIPSDRKQMWVGKVMAYLASQALQCGSQGKAPPRVPTKAIYADLGGNPNQEPSGWLSPIWKEIESRHYPEIEPTLIDLCRRNGLNVYPALEKDNGKPAFYRLAARELPPSEPLDGDNDVALPPNTVRYRRDLSLELSLLGKMSFHHGLKWTPFKRYGYLAWQMLFLIAAVVFVLLIWLILWYRKEPVTGQDLVLLATGVGFPCAVYRHFSGIFRLFDDRIMIAPDWTLAWKEFGATVEIGRSKDPDAPSTILVQRYSTTCPICGWMVKLDRGEPDFPRRIVGRCEEHPREHVFSFDRSTKRGVILHSGVGSHPQSPI